MNNIGTHWDGASFLAWSGAAVACHSDTSQPIRKHSRQQLYFEDNFDFWHEQTPSMANEIKCMAMAIQHRLTQTSDTRTIRGWLETTALNKLVTYLLGKINTFLSEQSALSQVSHTNNTFSWHIVMGWWKFNAKPFECGGCKQK